MTDNFHADEARRILAQAEAELVEALSSGAGLAAAIEKYPALIATAQVHATLALAPEPAPRLITPAELIAERRGTPDVRAGDRVVMLNPAGSERRHFRTLGSDTFGTVVSVSPDAYPEARVDWDDIHGEGEATPVEQLRVVLGV